MTTTSGVPPRAPASSRRIKLLAILLLAVMGGATIAVLALGWRAARLNTEVGELARERQTLSTDVETLRASTETLRAQNQALEADTRQLDEQRVRLRAEIDGLNQTLGTLRQSAPQQTASAERNAYLRPRVYLQVATDQSAAAAEELSKWLQDAGYVVPRIERVRAVPRQTQVRYFDPSDEELAGRVLAIVKRSRSDATAVLFQLGPGARMREHHIEVWL